MPKGVPNKHYTPEFKKLVIETMYQKHWNCVEAGKHVDVANQRVCDSERIYLTEGPDAFQIERCGYSSQGYPRKWSNEVEEDLLTEDQCLDHFKQERIDYIDYYNNRRIKAKLKGLPPALHRQQALLAA